MRPASNTTSQNEQKKKTPRLFDQNHEASGVKLDRTSLISRRPNQKSRASGRPRKEAKADKLSNATKSVFDGQARQGRESTVAHCADISDSRAEPITLLAAVGFFVTLHQSDHA